MGRHKEFDSERALSRAMNQFWHHGYENTSLEDLMRAMGIAKQSLYDTFGDKRSLYLRALAHYRAETNSAMKRLFSAEPNIRNGFKRLLFSLADETREQHTRGCLLLSANMERSAGDAVIANFLRQNQAEVESIFTDALRRAQKNGELSDKRDPAALARFFVVTIQGMRAMAKLRSDRKSLRQVAKVALSVFDQL